jgi:hypothetical protein
MSLVTQALLIAAQKVLTGSTWAETNVLKQPIDPISEVLRVAEGASVPVIAVYVETADFDIEGRRTQGKSAKIDLKVFVYISPGVVKLPEEAGYEFTLDGTVAGLTLDMMGRQIDAALHTSTSPWVEIFRKMVPKFTQRMEQFALIELEHGVRIPCLEILYKLESIPDPDFGTPIAGMAAWSMFDAQLRVEGSETTKLADLFKEMIERPEGLSPYQDIINNFGLTAGDFASTGLGPLPAAVDPDTGAVPVLEEITVEVTGTGTDPLS